MKKYKNFDIIDKIDIQEYNGLNSEVLTRFFNSEFKPYPLSCSCFGITYPSSTYLIKRFPARTFVLEHVISGKGHVIVNGKHYIVTAGDTYLLKPTENCEYYSDKTFPFKKIWVNFKGSLAQEIIQQHSLNETVYKNINLSPSFEKLFKLEEISTDLDVVQFDITSIITEMLMLLAKSKNTKNSVSNTAIMIKKNIEQHLTSTFTLDNLAKDLFLSKSQIVKEFKKSYGISPYQYLINIKINWAKIMLENNNYSIIDIADFFAFSSPYHFSNMFKQKTGLSPSEYRKKLREKH